MTESINDVHVRGRAGRDGEMRYTQSGTPQGSVGVAVSRHVRVPGSPDLLREVTDWVNVVAWGDRAESMVASIGKGDLVDVRGRLSSRSWDGDDGKRQYRTEVVANAIEIVEKAKAKRREADPAEDPDAPMYETATGRPVRRGEVDPDDLPFD